LPLKTSLFSITDLGVFQVAILLLIVAAFIWFLPRLMAMAVYRIFLLRFFGTDPPRENSILSYYYPDANGDFPVADFMLRPDGQRSPIYLQENYILETMIVHKGNFQQIWERLTGRQQYFVYDFAADGYTNYKDSETVMQLYRMGVLRHKGSNRRDEWTILCSWRLGDDPHPRPHHHCRLRDPLADDPGQCDTPRNGSRHLAWRNRPGGARDHQKDRDKGELDQGHFYLFVTHAIPHLRIKSF
jgi:hypothetical protein